MSKAILVTVATVLVSTASFAGNFDNDYNMVYLNCQSKSQKYEFILTHEKIAGVKRITQNIYDKDGKELEDQVNRRFSVVGMQKDTKIMISQRENERAAAQIDDKFLAIYVKTSDLLSKMKFEVGLASGTATEISQFKAASEAGECSTEKSVIIREE